MNDNIGIIKTKLEEYVNEITSRSKAGGTDMYICPLCGSGTPLADGKRHDGAFHIYGNKDKWKCHACGRGGTIIDLYGYIEGINAKDSRGFKRIIQALEDKYNIEDTSSFNVVSAKEDFKDIPTPEEQAERDYIEEEINLCIGACEHTVGFSDYLTNRGISLEVQRRFNIGYFGEWLHPKTKYRHFGKIKREWLTPRIIIPTSDRSYLARATTPEPPENDPRHKYYVKAYKVGEVNIFNSNALTSSDYCFIVEGEIDALSCIECGYNAIGLGSVTMIEKLFNNYEINKDIVLLLALDNDKAGQDSLQKLISQANAHGNYYIPVDSNFLFDGAKDCNEALQNDKKALIEHLEHYKQKALDLDKSTFFKSFEGFQDVGNNTTVAHHNGNGNNSTSSNVPEWYNLLRISQKGNIISSLHNIKTILQNDDTYKGKIEYNELTNMRTFNRTDWEDVHESMIKLYLEEQYNLVVSVENINHVCNIIEYNNRYHPIREHLSQLEWDGIPRVNTVFSDFLGAKNDIYTQKVASITFIGAVARIFQPGIKYDTCTVFVGRQGLGKSKFISKLAINQDWFTDGVTTFDGKEFYESIQGKWLVELGEGTAFQKSIKERSKQAIASQQDSYRKPYARNPITLKRQCIFFGTTNNYDFLKDETGDRRYYPIDVDRRNATKNMDTELTPKYVNQLWAEALERYKQGEEIYITDGNILTVAEQEQRNHFDENPLQSDIYNFLDILLPPPQEWYSMTLEQRKQYIQAVQSGEDTLKSLRRAGVYRRDRVSIKEIMCELYGYELNHPIERKISLDISRSLTALGWHKTGKAERINPYGLQRIFKSIL